MLNDIASMIRAKLGEGGEKTPQPLSSSEYAPGPAEVKYSKTKTMILHFNFCYIKIFV